MYHSESPPLAIVVNVRRLYTQIIVLADSVGVNEYEQMVFFGFHLFVNSNSCPK